MQVTKTYDPPRAADATGQAVFALYKKYKAEQSGYSSSCAYGTNATLHGKVASGDNKDVPDENRAPLDSTDGDFYLVGTPSPNAQGLYEWTGIDDGDYILLELSAPDGYEKMPKPIHFSISVLHEQEAQVNNDPKIIENDTHTQLSVRSENGVTNGYITNASGVSFLNGITATIPNYKTGSLDIIKAVPSTFTQDAASQTFTFEVAFSKNSAPYTKVPVYVQDAAVYSASGELLMAASPTGNWVLTDSNGKLLIKVTGTGTAHITKIPDGVTYTVTEKDIPTGWIQDGETVYSDSSRTISANDSPADTVTITNTKEMSLSVTKQWKKENADKTFAEPKNITFTLYQKLTNPSDPTDTSSNVYTGVSEHTDGKFTVNYTGNASTSLWEPVTIPNLPQAVIRSVTIGEGEGATTTQVTYTASYYVVENAASADAGYVLTTTYSTDGGTTTGTAQEKALSAQGTITIINTETAGVELPSTGGPGTVAFYLGGGMLALMALMMMLLRKKRRA